MHDEPVHDAVRDRDVGPAQLLCEQDWRQHNERAGEETTEPAHDGHVQILFDQRKDKEQDSTQGDRCFVDVLLIDYVEVRKATGQ